MERIPSIIEQIKKYRRGEHRPWIYTEDGKLREDIFTADTVLILEEINEYECDDEFIDKIWNSDEESRGNTYNWNANITNDFDWKTVFIDEELFTVIRVHLIGDIRLGYSDAFVVQGTMDDIFDLDSAIQTKDIPGTNYSADLRAWDEGFLVWDNENGTEIGTFYEIELEDLLKDINNKKEK